MEIKDIKKLPVVWVDKPIEHDNIRDYYVATTMIARDEREIECRLTCSGTDFYGHFSFDILERYNVPIRPAQMFRLYTCEVDGELMSWMEKYLPPMTPRKQALIDAIMTL